MKLLPAAPLAAPSLTDSPEVVHAAGPVTCGDMLEPVGGGAEVLACAVAVTVLVTVGAAAGEPPLEHRAAGQRGGGQPGPGGNGKRHRSPSGAGRQNGSSSVDLPHI